MLTITNSARVVLSATLAIAFSVSSVAAPEFKNKLSHGQILGLTMGQSVAEAKAVVQSYGSNSSLETCQPVDDVQGRQRYQCEVLNTAGITFANVVVNRMELVFSNEALTDVYLRLYPTEADLQKTVKSVREELGRTLSAVGYRRSLDTFVSFERNNFGASYQTLHGTEQPTEVTVSFVKLLN